MKRKLLFLSVVLFLVIVAVYYFSLKNTEKQLTDRPVADAPSIGGKNAKDQNESGKVAAFIRSSYIATGVDKNTFSLYCKGGNRSLNITIYGITRHSDQDLIVQSVKSEMPKRGWKRVYLLFLERENWVQSESGYSRQRTDEKKLYGVVLE